MLRHLSESDRALVEQAKGALMLRYGTGSRESLAVLERWALEAQVPLREVAEALVGGICLGRVTSDNEGIVRWLEHRLRGEISDVRGDGREDGRRDGRGDGRGTADGPAAATGTVTATVPTPAPAVVPAPAAVPAAAAVPAVEARQWRYSSAVHAARVLRSR